MEPPFSRIPEAANRTQAQIRLGGIHGNQSENRKIVSQRIKRNIAVDINSTRRDCHHVLTKWPFSFYFRQARLHASFNSSWVLCCGESRFYCNQDRDHISEFVCHYYIWITVNG